MILLPKNYKLLLHDTKTILKIEDGDVDLFLVSPIHNAQTHFIEQLSTQLHPFLGDIITGKLKYITNFKQGDTIFPFPLSEHDIMLIRANIDTTINIGTWDHITSDQVHRWMHAITTPIKELSHLENGPLRIQTVDKTHSIKESLLAFHKHYLQSLIKFNKELVDKEDEELFLKEEREQELLDETLKALGSILTHKQTAPITFKNRDPLLTTCQMIGQYLPHKFISSSLPYVKNQQDRLYNITSASHIFYRHVHLPPCWWQTNHGPMLGYTNKQEPIALIPTQSHRYEIWRPHHKKKTEVNGMTVSSIESEAVIFYRSLPNKTPLNATDLIAFCLKDKQRGLVNSLLSSSLGVLFTITIPLAVKILIDTVFPLLHAALFLQILIGLSLLAIGVTALKHMRDLMTLRLETLFTHDLCTAIWGRLLSLPVHFFREMTVGDLIQRISLIESIPQMVTRQGVSALSNILLAILYFTILLYFNIPLALIGLGIISIAFIFTGYCTVIIEQKEQSIQDLEGKMNGNIMQIIMGLSKIRTNGSENRIFSFWAHHHLKSQQKCLQVKQLQNLTYLCNDLSRWGAMVVILVVFLHFLQNPTFHMTMGSFIAFQITYWGFSQTLVDFNALFVRFIAVVPIWNRCKSIFHTPLEITKDRINPGQLHGDVKVEHLSFRYDKSASVVLDDISLHAKAGEFIAIVGPSGCGKSTLARLLIGFEIPEQGGIYYDDKDLSHLDLREIRSQIGIVMQNSKIVDGTIYDNIIGTHMATQADITEAVQLAGLKKDIEQMPMGLKTCLTAGGATLSGGQRQRLLIARALLSKGKILILDEATNALDNQTQECVAQNLNMLGMTRIVIAHHFATVKGADRIYVMDRGKVVKVIEKGE